MGHCYFQQGDLEEALKCYEFANMVFDRPDDIYLLQLRYRDISHQIKLARYDYCHNCD